MNSRRIEFDTLSLEQKYAACRVKQGHNLFITGPGGTGKSRLIQYLFQTLTESGVHFQVCAMTGCAAVLLGCKASTLHSWSGIRLARDPTEKIIAQIQRNKKLTKTWRQVRTLIIDEISMMSAHIFELLDGIGRVIRGVAKPFGGIQLIFTGDFFQLPPVGLANSPDGQFCFESDRWNHTFPPENCVDLTTVFRQTDPKYIEILREIRRGQLSDENAAILREHVSRPFDETQYGGCKLAKLFPIRTKVDNVNTYEFNKLNSMEYEYEYIPMLHCRTYLDGSGKNIDMFDMAKARLFDKEDYDREVKALMSQSQTPDKLSLKEGSSVMSTTNLDVERGICNGTQGIVVGFAESHSEHGFGEIPIVRFSNGVHMRIQAQFRHSSEYPTIAVGQMPLCLAWALTIHKIQGATMRMAEIDIGSSVFEFGQTYVALSRIQSLDGLYLSSFHPSRIKANPKVVEFYDALAHASNDKMDEYVRAHGPVPMPTIELDEGVKNISISAAYAPNFRQYEYKPDAAVVVNKQGK
jgi:ATP-dependent DNA helicase PIF1